MGVQLEIQLKALYDPGEKVLEVKSWEDGFLALTESSKLLFFDSTGIRQVADLGLRQSVLLYSWEETGRLAALSGDAQGSTLAMLNVDTGEKFSVSIADKVSGVQATEFGALYWGPSKAGLFKGYLALASPSGGWRVELPMLQAAACWGDLVYAAAYNGKIYRAKLSAAQAPVFTEVSSAPGRIRKVIPRGSVILLVGSDRVFLVGPEPRVIELGEEITLAKAVGRWAVLAASTSALLLDLETISQVRLYTGKVFDADGRGDDVYLLTSDEVLEVSGGRVARRVSLGGLPATILRVGRDYALYFFQALAYATVELPQVSAAARLIEVMETGEAVYEVEAFLRAPSSLAPLSGRVTLVVGGERLEGPLDEAGRATFRVKVREPVKLSVASELGEFKAAELELQPPKRGFAELGRGDVLVRGDGTSWFVQEKLGSGGFGTVYRVLDPVLERSLAVKILLLSGEEEPERIKALLDEAWFLAQASRKLNREKKIVVETHGIERFTVASTTGAKKGVVYGLVMEYVEGGSLASLISAGTAPVELRVNIAVALAEALARLHREGIVHGDLKPQNVLLRQNKPLLTDFGAARLFKVAGEILPLLAYTPAYAPPEALTKILTDKSDVYSLGTMLIELLTGDLPAPQSTNIPAKAVEKIRRIRGGYALCDLISRMRREKPEHRPSSQQVFEEMSRIFGPPI